MKARMEIEGQPFEKLVNTIKTEVSFGDLEQPKIDDFVQLFFNFCTQIGYSTEDTYSVIQEMVSSELNEEDEELLEENEENVVDYIEKTLYDRRADIQKIINDKDNREQFLKQLNSNKEMLKEAFKLYLQDTLGINNEE